MNATVFHRLAAALLGTLAAGAAHAQTGAPLPTRAMDQQCGVVPDSVRPPTPGQIAERGQLRDRLVAIGRRNGVTAPTGLLMVDVDSTYKGSVLFMESNYPEAAVRQTTEAVSEYLSTLPRGRRYQALIRVDGEYPAVAPGHQHCRPVMLNWEDQRTAMDRVWRGHPERGKLAAPVNREVVLLLVVSREGRVTYSGVARPSGDAYLDEAAPAIGRVLKFEPATLDGIPFDARYRLRLPFTIR